MWSSPVLTLRIESHVPLLGLKGGWRLVIKPSTACFLALKGESLSSCTPGNFWKTTKAYL
jgi:hypothetical protein